MPGDENATPRPSPVIDRGPDQPSSFLGRIPLHLGQYQIIRELGRGGMGIVFLAQQPTLNRNIALKVMNTSMDTPEDEVRRFRAEAQMAAQLHHPNIVQVFEVGEQDGLAFLAMEHVEGGSLHQHLGKNRLTPHEAVELLEPLARAMHYAHTKGIVHRDLKPANVLLSMVREPDLSHHSTKQNLAAVDGPPSSKRLSGTRGGDNGPIPKITDFGLAKRFNQSTNMTAMGIALGTPSYMSPEQARDDRALVGPGSDVYSLGAILYEMLTGKPPFSASTPLATLEKVVRDRPVPPRRINPEVSPELERICLKCLEKKPQNRYPSAEALADDLRHFLVASEVIAAVRARWNLWRWVKQHPTIAIGMLGVVVFLIALTFYKLREEAADADKIARDVRNNARRDHEEALREKLTMLQRELPLAVQRGLTLCDQGDIEQGLQWFHRAQGQVEEAQLPAYEHVIRANLAAWDKQLTPVLHTIQVPDGVFALVSSPEGNWIASGGRNGVIRFWDASSGSEVGKALEVPAPANKLEVKQLAWSSDGKMLASASGSQIDLWNVAERRHIGDVWELGEDVDSVSFAADGQYVFATSRKGGVRTRKTFPLEEPVETIGHHTPGARVVCGLSQNGNQLATAGQDGQLRLWTKTLGRWITMDTVVVGSPVESLAWTGDNRQVILGCRDGKLFICDLETKTLHPLPPQGSAVTTVLGTPDGRRLISCTQHGVLRIFDAVSRTPIGQVMFAQSPITALSCQRDNQSIAVGHEDGSIRIHRLPARQETGPRIHNPRGKDDASVYSVQFSRDRKWLLVAMSPRAMLWETGPESSKNPYTFDDTRATTAALSSDGKWVAFGGGGHAELFDVQSTKKIPLADPLDRLENLTQILFTPSGSRMISLSPNRPGPKIGPLGSWVWNLDHLKVGVEELRTPPTRILSKLSAEVNQAAFHPDGRWLILACSDKLVRIWDIETDTPQAVELAHSSAAISVSINHEGNRIFSGCRDGSIHYWNAATGEELWSSQQGGEILATAVSADGMMVLSGSSNGTARFWDAATGVAIGPAIHHADAVLSVGFRADGKLAVTGSRDRTAQVWRVPE